MVRTRTLWGVFGKSIAMGDRWEGGAVKLFWNRVLFWFKHHCLLLHIPLDNVNFFETIYFETGPLRIPPEFVLQWKCKQSQTHSFFFCSKYNFISEIKKKKKKIEIWKGIFKWNLMERVSQTIPIRNVLRNRRILNSLVFWGMMFHFREYLCHYFYVLFDENNLKRHNKLFL